MIFSIFFSIYFFVFRKGFVANGFSIFVISKKMWKSMCIIQKCKVYFLSFPLCCVYFLDNLVISNIMITLFPYMQIEMDQTD